MVWVDRTLCFFYCRLYYCDQGHTGLGSVQKVMVSAPRTSFPKKMVMGKETGHDWKVNVRSPSARKQNDFMVGEGVGTRLVLWCFFWLSVGLRNIPELAQAGSGCPS